MAHHSLGESHFELPLREESLAAWLKSSRTSASG
jgi:hypothetical protein